MRKFYIIKIILGPLVSSLDWDNGFENAPSRATDTQQQDIDTTIDATQAKRFPTGVWLRRADARRVAKKANERNPYVTYSVVGVGEFKRTVRPVLGYRFKRGDGRGEWYNEVFQGPASHAAEAAKVNT